MPALGTGRIAPRVEPGNKYSQGGPLYGQKLGGIAERQELSEAAGEAASATAAAAAVGPGPLNSLINRTNRAREGFRRQTVLQSQVDAEKEKLALAREQEVRQWAQMALEGKFKGMEMQRQQQALDAQISQNKQENAFRKEDLGLRREGQAFDQVAKGYGMALEGKRVGLAEDEAKNKLAQQATENYFAGERLALEKKDVENRGKYYEGKGSEKKALTTADTRASIETEFAATKIPRSELVDPETGDLTSKGQSLQSIIIGLKNERGLTGKELTAEATRMYNEWVGGAQVPSDAASPSRIENDKPAW